MLLCLGDRGVGAAMRAEAMTAGVEEPALAKLAV
jgi:hypothetical protein